MSEKQYRHTGKKTELKITRWHPPYHCLPNQSASWKTADLLVVVKGTRIRPYDNVMQNFDSIDYCYDQHGNKVLSGEYQDKNGPAPVLETRMKIDGTFAVQEAVPDSKWKKIYIVSARIEKSKEP